MRSEELSAEGPWELVERSGAERTLFPVVMESQTGSVLLSGKCNKCQQQEVS